MITVVLLNRLSSSATASGTSGTIASAAVASGTVATGVSASGVLLVPSCHYQLLSIYVCFCFCFVLWISRAVSRWWEFWFESCDRTSGCVESCLSLGWFVRGCDRVRERLVLVRDLCIFCFCFRFVLFFPRAFLLRGVVYPFGRMVFLLSQVVPQGL